MTEPAQEPKRIAILYWGLVRTLREVYPLQKKYVYDELDTSGIEYDVFVHTWTTGKNLVWNRPMAESIDYAAIDILNPTSRQIDPQDEFVATIDMNRYYYPGECEWEPYLIQNHLCALESMKRCCKLCLESGNKYDYVMFLRPDALLNRRLPVEDIFNHEFRENTIILPNFNHWEGYNDQFAILNFHNFLWYGERIDGIAEFRKTNGRIVSEKYLKYVVDQHYETKQVNFQFDLLRPNGKLNGDI